MTSRRRRIDRLKGFISTARLFDEVTHATNGTYQAFRQLAAQVVYVHFQRIGPGILGEAEYCVRECALGYDLTLVTHQLHQDLKFSRRQLDDLIVVAHLMPYRIDGDAANPPGLSGE